MPLKFQFQFAGADFSRPSSPYRKWLRIGLMSLVATLSVLAYWAYLHHLTHRALPAVSHVVPVTPKADVPAVAPTLKNVATEGIVAVESYLLKAAKISPAAPVATAAPSEPVAVPVPAPVAVAAPVITFVPAPVPQRTYRVHTDQERLVMAGQTAFDNVMDLANKYPDAYGFQAGDFLSDAKLGQPIAVYTIAESDRANYQNGQPVKPLLKPARQWVFPVLMNDRICCMVEVSQAGHEYVPGKGNKSLAMAWNKINEKWPAEDGYHPMLVVNPEVPGYYFTVPELPQQNLTDTIEMFYFHPGTSPADVILASWR
jgi:hypothetical protein